MLRSRPADVRDNTLLSYHHCRARQRLRSHWERRRFSRGDRRWWWWDQRRDPGQRRRRRGRGWCVGQNGCGIIAVEAWVEGFDPLEQWRMRREAKEPALQSISEKEVARLFRAIGLKFRPLGESADFFQRLGQTRGIASELDRGSVRQKFALPADSGLDEPAKQNANPADDDEGNAEKWQRILFPAGLNKDASDNSQAKNSEDQPHEPKVQLHV